MLTSSVACAQGVTLLQLDMGLLIAGAKERGEIEKRITTLLAELEASRGKIVLVVDEIHTLVGAGSVAKGGAKGTVGGGNSAGLDVANLLKPALSSGRLRCIGATTLAEHRAHFEADPALARRFQPVHVREPTQPEALEVRAMALHAPLLECSWEALGRLLACAEPLHTEHVSTVLRGGSSQVLQGLASRYEAYHRVCYTPAALRAAVELSARYVQDRCLPDKAIDLLDEAGSRARMTAYYSRRAVLDDPDLKLEELQQVCHFVPCFCQIFRCIPLGRRSSGGVCGRPA